MKKILLSLLSAAALLAGAIGLAACGEHVYAEEWSSDASRHWHACTAHKDCSSREGLAPHRFEETGTTEDGKKIFTCSVCKRVSTETPLEAPTVTLNGKELSWAKVDSATGYEIYRDGERVESVNFAKTSYIIDEAVPGAYSYTVVATTNQAGYCASEPSTAVVYKYYAKLGTPEASVTRKGVLSWTAVPNATGYKVYLLNTSVEGSEEIVRDAVKPPYTIVEETEGTYDISVQAVSDNEYYTESDRSAAVKFTVQKRISAPTLTLAGCYLTWTTVENANGYRVYRDGTDPITPNSITEARYLLSECVFEVGAGVHKYTVVATANPSSEYLDSVPSNEVSLDVTAPFKAGVGDSVTGSPLFGSGEAYASYYRGFFIEFTGELDKDYRITVSGFGNRGDGVTVCDHLAAKVNDTPDTYFHLSGSQRSGVLHLTGNLIFVYETMTAEDLAYADSEKIAVTIEEAPSSSPSPTAEVTLALPPAPRSPLKKES